MYDWALSENNDGKTRISPVLAFVTAHLMLICEFAFNWHWLGTLISEENELLLLTDSILVTPDVCPWIETRITGCSIWKTESLGGTKPQFQLSKKGCLESQLSRNENYGLYPSFHPILNSAGSDSCRKKKKKLPFVL